MLYQELSTPWLYVTSLFEKSTAQQLHKDKKNTFFYTSYYAA